MADRRCISSTRAGLGLGFLSVPRFAFGKEVLSAATTSALSLRANGFPASSTMLPRGARVRTSPVAPALTAATYCGPTSACMYHRRPSNVSGSENTSTLRITSRSPDRSFTAALLHCEAARSSIVSLAGHLRLCSAGERHHPWHDKRREHHVVQDRERQAAQHGVRVDPAATEQPSECAVQDRGDGGRDTDRDQAEDCLLYTSD